METLALNYATALLQIAKDESKNKEYRLQVKSILETLEASDDLLLVLSSNLISKREKLDLFKELLKDEDKFVQDFILVIIENNRSNALIPILKEFIRISNLEDGIIEGIVYSTSFLTKEEIRKLEDAISKKINKEIVLKNRLDNSLIGGVKIIVDDYNFDGSIKNKLNKLNQYLKGDN